MKNINNKNMLTSEELGQVSGGVMTDYNKTSLDNMIGLYRNGSTLDKILTDASAIWDEYEEVGVPEQWKNTSREECLDYISQNW